MKNQNIQNQFTAGEWGADLLNAEHELKSTEEFQFYPIAPITVTNASVHMEDDFNGEAHVEFSNGDQINYECREKRGDCGADADVQIIFNDKVIETDLDLGEWGGSGWINLLTNYYVKNELYSK
jgi:hypothetical protein